MGNQTQINLSCLATTMTHHGGNTKQQPMADTPLLSPKKNKCHKCLKPKNTKYVFHSQICGFLAEILREYSLLVDLCKAKSQREVKAGN